MRIDEITKIGSIKSDVEEILSRIIRDVFDPRTMVVRIRNRLQEYVNDEYDSISVKVEMTESINIAGSLERYKNDNNGYETYELTLRIPRRYLITKKDQLPRIAATTFAHEMGHYLQQQNTQKFPKHHDVDDYPWDVNVAKSYKNTSIDTMDDLDTSYRAKNFLYLTSKSEIDMWAYSAAQELYDLSKDHSKQSMEILKNALIEQNVKEIKKYSKHLGDMIDQIKRGKFNSIKAWKRFLKRTYQYLEYLNQK
ncbi:MAG: hypothetical protein WC284_18200 [Candidimonas sp.]